MIAETDATSEHAVPAQIIHSPLAGASAAIIASIPHSGLYIPAEHSNGFSPTHLRVLSHTDWYLNEFFDFLPELGVTTIIQSLSRYVIDVNRDPLLPLIGPWGKSLTPSTTAFGKQVYERLPLQSELHERKRRYYDTFHTALQDLLAKSLQAHNRALLLDLHSFGGPLTEDFVIGTCHGRSCEDRLTKLFAESVSSAGYQVAVDEVYSGGYITNCNFCQPQVQAMQIEMRYNTYSDPEGEPASFPKRDSRKWNFAQQALRKAIIAVLSIW